MKSWWSRFWNLVRGGRIARLTIAIDGKGINVEDARGDKVVLPWNSINRIAVYKKDVYAGDLICLGVELANARAIELDERMQGWDQLLILLPLHLPDAMSMEKAIVGLFAKDTNDSVTIFSREQ